jgi:hypothetical protein
LNEGPALRVSLNRVTGRARLGGSVGSEDCGESIVVANARVLGVRDREMVVRVDVESRLRDRGIEDAIVKCVKIEREKETREMKR